MGKRGEVGGLFKIGKTWYARWRYDGKLYRVSTKTGVRAEAERVLRDLTEDFDSRNRLAVRERVAAKVRAIEGEIDARAAARPALALADAFDAFAASPERADCAGVTLDHYRSQFGRFVGWMRDSRPEATEMRHVTHDDAALFLAHLDRTASPNTRNKYLVLLRSVWKVVGSEARCKGNPWEGIRRRRQSAHSRRELSPDELRAVLAAAPEGEMRLLFALGTYTGLRLGDCATLPWMRVDLDAGFIRTVPRKTAAHGTLVKVPIHPDLAALLAAVPPRDRRGPVLPECAALYERDASLLSRRISAVFRAAGIETQTGGMDNGRPHDGQDGRRARVDVGFHSLRHTYVSLCANAGVPLALVQSIVGHTSPAMTQHYFHADDDALRRAAAALPSLSGAPPPPDNLSAFRAAVAALRPEEFEMAENILREARKKFKKRLTRRPAAVVVFAAEGTGT